ncbi:putative antirepressor - phage associated [Lentibacillus populi]|uniref:Antirepressor - phage associated n=1 Tax=Lentibacillus populi TaxID=1827502 RepID=A0A9W5U259_9BACI|nr:phage antirepressor KilAC domain-containing protein [Lentibacillus populi]GGB61336.1 putative antirepressor - phage associated [Lentibacillus populi]
MNQLTKMFDGQNLTIITNGDDHEFLLKDLCNILGLGHVATVKRRLDKDVVSKHPLQTAGGTQQATFVNEDGLYDVILDSRKPEAKRFRKWITSEVLPSIRKHGAYATDQTIENIINNPDFGIELLKTLKTERDQRLKAEQERMAVVEQQRIDAPYTSFGKVVSNSSASINVGSFAKMMYEKHGINLGRNKMFEWLRDKGFLIKSGRERNNPKQQYIEQGLFDVKPTVVSRSTGDVEKLTTLITGKGQVKLSQMLLEQFGSKKAVI